MKTIQGCTKISMEFFDRLAKCDVVTASGHLRGCIPEYLDDGLVVNQELGKVLLMEESKHFDEYDEDERNEFLFRMLTHLSLGGPVNQVDSKAVWEGICWARVTQRDK
eukprot:m.84887 g.84887  ORF g.84887 m.84887 type:complete len:108 (+) comp21225_c0_seq6:11-334(+)